LKIKESDENEPDLQEISGDIAAASMVEKLRGLQDVASKHGFKFLVYMLDMARAEAESLRKDNQQS
jgi:hypothetical protein